jgi:hypothetical protein
MKKILKTKVTTMEQMTYRRRKKSSSLFENKWGLISVFLEILLARITNQKNRNPFHHEKYSLL